MASETDPLLLLIHEAEDLLNAILEADEGEERTGNAEELQSVAGRIVKQARV